MVGVVIEVLSQIGLHPIGFEGGCDSFLDAREEVLE